MHQIRLNREFYIKTPFTESKLDAWCCTVTTKVTGLGFVHLWKYILKSRTAGTHSARARSPSAPSALSMAPPAAGSEAGDHNIPRPTQYNYTLLVPFTNTPRFLRMLTNTKVIAPNTLRRMLKLDNASKYLFPARNLYTTQYINSLVSSKYLLLIKNKLYEVMNLKKINY